VKPLETEVSRRPEVSGLPLDGTSPAGRLLGNGRWVTLLTAAGGGFSSLDGIALTRWRGDRVSDADGAFVYLRDLDTHGVRSLAHQPCRVPAERYDVTERPGVVTFTRRDDGLEASLDVCVVPGMQAELRRVTLRDHSGRARRIELTSYVEVVLHHAAADAAHPAFAKLFVQTQRASDPDALLARRRPRSPDESYPWLAHAVAGQRADQFETDRARFIGRGGSLAEPTALASGATLSGSVGNVLDPVLALRRVVRLEPNGFGSLTFVLAADAERDGVLALVRRLGEPLAVESAFAAAEDHALAELDRLGLSLDEAERAQALAVGMLYRVPELRASPVVLALAGSPQPAPPVAVPPGAWPVFVDARGEETGIALPALVRAQRLWETFGIRTAVMVLRDERTAPATPSLDGVQFVDASRVAPAFLDRWLADARLVLGPAGEPGATTGRSAARRRNGAGPRIARPASRAGSRNDTSGLTRGVDSPGAATWLAEPLLAWNGHGGFSEDGNEYVIRMPMTTPGRLRRPPLPWTNVLASERFGCLVSDTGAGPTWSRNSREHRLTPWCNDPVLDPHEEAVHVRDEDSGRFWSPLPGPTPGVGDYETRHGFGYSLFRHAGEGLEHETLVFVARNDPVKVVRVRLTNRTAGSRRLSLFSYQRLVLGVDPPASAHHVITEYSVEADALLAHGRARLPEGGVAFAAVVAPGGLLAHHVTGDRAAYLGRHGDIADPLAVASTRTLDDRTGAALDPCFAQQVLLELPAGATIECSFLFGEADHAEAARAVVHRYRIAGAIDAAAEEVRSFWSHLLGAVRPGAQRLDALPDARLPHVGPHRVLPVGRRVRLPGPAPGFSGVPDRLARAHAGPDPPARRPPVRGG
jgi:cellobiose phosphorylase